MRASMKCDGLTGRRERDILVWQADGNNVMDITHASCTCRQNHNLRFTLASNYRRLWGKKREKKGKKKKGKKKKRKKRKERKKKGNKGH